MASTNGGYMPQSDGALLSFAEHMHSVLVLDPTGFGTTTGDVTALDTRTTDFAAKMALVEPSIRNKASVAGKNSSKILLRDQIRLITNQVQNYPGITDEQLTELGLTVRKQHPTPVPVPTETPEMDILSVTGRVVKARLHGETIEHRRRPTGTVGAYIWTFAGETPPEDLSGWLFWGNATKTLFEVDFPVSVEPGTKVWLAAGWVNTKGEVGPVCDPVSTYVQFGGVSLTVTQGMKKAA